MAEGWLWDSILRATARPSPSSTTPAFSAPAGNEDAGRVAGEETQQGLGVLVAAVLAPECAEQAKLHGVGLAVQALDYLLVLLGRKGDLSEGLRANGHATSVLPGGCRADGSSPRGAQSRKAGQALHPQLGVLGCGGV